MAIMYMPVEPKLLEYVYRGKQDVPFEANVVKFEKIKTVDEKGVKSVTEHAVSFDGSKSKPPKTELKLSGFGNIIDHGSFDGVCKTVNEHYLTSSYDKVINIFGRFKQEAIALGLSELK